MQYLYMQPDQIRQAIDNNTPVVLPLGVVEYHGEHLPVGLDCFTCLNAIGRVEQRHPELVILPPFYYGSASFAVAKPERNGTVHVESEHIVPVAKDIFRGLLRVGFRNIHAFVAHQTEEFAQGMPTDLAFRFAARNVIFEFLDKESGEGWWGTEEFSSYYSGSNNPFKWIQVHPIRTREETKKKFKGDHAGHLETSAAMHICPECVNKEKIDGSLWFTRPAVDSTAEFGNEAQEAASRDIEAILFPEA